MAGNPLLKFVCVFGVAVGTVSAQAGGELPPQTPSPDSCTIGSDSSAAECDLVSHLQVKQKDRKACEWEKPVGGECTTGQKCVYGEYPAYYAIDTAPGLTLDKCKQACQDNEACRSYEWYGEPAYAAGYGGCYIYGPNILGEYTIPPWEMKGDASSPAYNIEVNGSSGDECGVKQKKNIFGQFHFKRSFGDCLDSAGEYTTVSYLESKAAGYCQTTCEEACSKQDKCVAAQVHYCTCWLYGPEFDSSDDNSRWKFYLGEGSEAIVEGGGWQCVTKKRGNF